MEFESFYLPQIAAHSFSDEGQTMKLWDLHTGQCLKTWRGYVTASGRLQFGWPTWSVGEEQTAKLWDVQTGRCLKLLKGHIGCDQLPLAQMIKRSQPLGGLFSPTLGRFNRKMLQVMGA